MTYRHHSLAVVFAGLLLPFASQAGAQTVAAPRCGAGVHVSEASGTVAFPEDQIFCPLIADPKEPRSFVSFLRGTFRSLDDPGGEGTSIASVGVGDTFGLLRVGGPDPGEGFQIGVVGSIFAQFDLGAPERSDRCRLRPRVSADVPETWLQLPGESVSPEFPSRRRIPASQRRDRAREPVVRVVRISGVSGTRGAAALRRC